MKQVTDYEGKEAEKVVHNIVQLIIDTIEVNRTLGLITDATIERDRVEVRFVKMEFGQKSKEGK